MINPLKTKKIVTWCRSHDWGVNAYYANGSIHGLTDYTYNSATDEHVQGTVSFDSLTAIRSWAGY